MFFHVLFSWFSMISNDFSIFFHWSSRPRWCGAAAPTASERAARPRLRPSSSAASAQRSPSWRRRRSLRKLKEIQWNSMENGWISMKMDKSQWNSAQIQFDSLHFKGQRPLLLRGAAAWLPLAWPGRASEKGTNEDLVLDKWRRRIKCPIPISIIFF